VARPVDGVLAASGSGAPERQDARGAPFSHDGSKPVYHLGWGNQGNTYVKKASPDRVKEILGVLDYLAAPFGTQEQLLLTYGIKDQDYAISDTGDPVAVNGGFSSHPVPWRYLTQYPAVQYNAVNSEEYAKVVRPVEETMVAGALQDPTLRLYSPTYANLNITLSTMVNDAITDIVVGRRPMSDFDQVVKDWRDKGGDKMRAEYEQALANANT
jgi:putative aldouronate transport system substrate-binding protein